MQDHTTNQEPQEIPFGYCQCGCGQKTWISTITSTKNGWVKGQPVKFIHGHATRKSGTLADAFWSLCARGAIDECWEWQGGTTSFGYGQLYYHRKQYKTHRLSYELHFGPILNGLNVLHKCDNPPCCNPNHLFLGTRAENVEDMIQKGRKVNMRSEQCHTAKITPTDVVEIRRLYKEGMSQTAIAKMYDVKQTTISCVVHHKTWKHIF